MPRPLVIIESPYAGDINRNLTYARRCMRDSIDRGERPFASHLLYTQPEVLRDDDIAEREQGIRLGYEFWDNADRIAFYVDLGWSQGMIAALKKLTIYCGGKPFYLRYIYFRPDDPTPTTDADLNKWLEREIPHGFGFRFD